MRGARTPASNEREPLVVALLELVRGLEPADARTGGALLGERRGDDLRRALSALSTVLVRTLVLLHAEARGLADGAAVRTLHAELDAERRAGGDLGARTGAWGRWHGGLRSSLAAPLGRADLEGAPVGDDVVLRAIGALLFEDGRPVAYEALDVEHLGGAYERLLGLDLRIAAGAPATRGHRAEPAGALVVIPGEGRRRTGSHYTPRALTAPLVAATLGPLLDRPDAPAEAEAILDLKVCDPAMGSGAFLVEACRQLGDRVARAWASAGGAPAGVDPVLAARGLVAERCLYGVDADPRAVEIARASLWLIAGARDRPPAFAALRLREGDALVGAGMPGSSIGPRPDPGALPHLDRRPLHWPDAFPEVFDRARPGFDAFVGNPPWVAYAGRAAQPLARDLFAHYVRAYASFRGYRTLHGLFVHRAASLLRPGGRMGLVVPTSISDLAGYEPTRRAHDALCEVDPELPDFGDAFEGVFQPSMGLVSTRRDALPPPARSAPPWRVARTDVDPPAEALLARLAALPPLPAACFGERGFQSTRADAARLRATGRPEPPFVVPIREGADVRAFRALPPRLYLDPAGLSGRLRAEASFQAVHVLVRQTARFPIAALSDGAAFRNSVLACFGAEDHSAHALLAWLNASPIRWLHYMRHRDARQGMPQVKIGHLRAIPRPPARVCPELHAIGEALGARNAGASPEERRRLDDVVAGALDLSAEERALIAAWAARIPAP